VLPFISEALKEFKVSEKMEEMQQGINWDLLLFRVPLLPLEMKRKTTTVLPF